MMKTELKSILGLEVPVVVLLAEQSMKVRDVLSLVPGSIIELGKPVDDDLVLLVNNCTVGRGVAMKIGENFGIEITQMGDSQTKVKAMGTTKVSEEPDLDALAAAMLAGQL